MKKDANINLRSYLLLLLFCLPFGLCQAQDFNFTLDSSYKDAINISNIDSTISSILSGSCEIRNVNERLIFINKIDSSPITRNIIIKYSSGAVAITGSIENGVYVRTWSINHSDGTKFIELTYNKGIKDGIVRTHMGKDKWTDFFYRDGVYTDTCSNYENGKLKNYLVYRKNSFSIYDSQWKETYFLPYSNQKDKLNQLKAGMELWQVEEIIEEKFFLTGSQWKDMCARINGPYVFKKDYAQFVFKNCKLYSWKSLK